MNDTTRLRFRSDDTVQFFKFIFLIARLNALKRRIVRDFASVMLRDLTAYTPNDVMHTSVSPAVRYIKLPKCTVPSVRIDASMGFDPLKIRVKRMNDRSLSPRT